MTSLYLPCFLNSQLDLAQIKGVEVEGGVSGDQPEFLFSPKTEPVISAGLSFLLSNLLPSDTIKIWVFFTDKGILTQKDYNESKTIFINSLCPAGLKRRAKNRVKADFVDLPVNQDYIEKILSDGARLRQRSRWLNAGSFEIQANKVADIAHLPFVRKIQKVAGFKKKPIEVDSYSDLSPKEFNQPKYGRNYGLSLAQVDQINVPIVHDMGYRGQNVIVCMLDTGCKKDHQAFALAFSEERVLAEYDFINHDSNTQNEPGDPADQHYHGTYTWSTLGGEVEGKLYGPAYGASFLLAKTEDVSSEQPIEEDNWVAGMEWGDSLGAEVISSSLGYFDWYTFEDFDGNTAVTTIAADIAASRGIVVCNAMGNEGPGYGTLIAPADADSILACGAADVFGNLASFSSWGPTYDGRIKPEVVARGVKTYCADALSTDAYVFASGTSLSTPLVGGCAAVLLSAHQDWTVMQVREALMMSASTAESPNIQYGWGIVDLFSALNYNPLGALTILHDPSLYISDTLNSILLATRITSANGVNPDSLSLFWRTDTLSSFLRENLQPFDINQYQVQIPAQSSGTTIFYYFSARDSLGNMVTLPLGAPRFMFKSYVGPSLITLDFEDGLYFWETGGTGNKWSLNSASAHGGLFSLTDSPTGGYSNNVDSWIALKQGIDLTSAISPRLSFWHRYSLWVYDSCFVEINTDIGKSWQRLLPGFANSQNEWTQVNFPLNSYVGSSNFKFRFHIISDSLGISDGWYIDDVRIDLMPTSVPEEPISIPTNFTLYQNYPNPFNPTTVIVFKIQNSRFKVPVHTTLKIYNILGQLVRVLADEKKLSGTYQVIWDGKDNQGKDVASGVYFYQMGVEDQILTKKMLLLK